jgi:hypothetical protein
LSHFGFDRTFAYRAPLLHRARLSLEAKVVAFTVQRLLSKSVDGMHQKPI